MAEDLSDEQRIHPDRSIQGGGAVPEGVRSDSPAELRVVPARAAAERQEHSFGVTWPSHAVTPQAAIQGPIDWN
jgi:hypothetical protein